MTDEDFRNTITQKVGEYVDSWGLSEDKSFVMFCAADVLGVDEEEAFEAVELGGKNDLSCDLGYIDAQHSEILLGQGKYSTKVTRDHIRALKELPRILSDAAEVRKREGNEQVRDFGREYRKYCKRGYEVTSYLFSMGNLSSGLRGELGTIQNFDFRRLKQEYEQRSTTTFAAPPKTVELSVPSNLLFKLRDERNRPRCLIAYLPLRQLYDLFQQHGIGLFDDNVRLHAGNKTPANDGMLRTLKSESADNFGFYNNGISVLCRRFKDSRIEEKGCTKIVLTDAQVINGAQTTFTIGSLDEDQVPDRAHVLVRVVCPPKTCPEEFKEDVIRFSNTQTPVKTRDFRANDDRQKRLFKAFDQWRPPYFYERKGGLWEQTTPKQQSRFKRKGSRTKRREGYRVIDSTVLAQCRLAWEGRPGAAKSGKQQIFVLVSDGGMYEEVFPENCDDSVMVGEYITSYELLRKLKEEKTKWGKERKAAMQKEDTQEAERLERYQFLTQFHFFAIAGVRYIQKRHCLSKERGSQFGAAILEETGFHRLFKLLRTIFSTTIRSEQKAAANAGQTFNLNNWFKRDDNFRKTIQPAIDDEHERVADVVEAILTAK